MMLTIKPVLTGYPADASKAQAYILVTADAPEEQSPCLCNDM